MPYTTEKAKLPEGFVDLGEKLPGTLSVEAMPAEELETEFHYPSLYFSDAKGLEGLPEEGTATISFKKVMEKSETLMRDGQTVKRYCVELQINGIKPDLVMSEKEEEDDEEEIEKGLKEAEEED